MDLNNIKKFIFLFFLIGICFSQKNNIYAELGGAGQGPRRPRAQARVRPDPARRRHERLEHARGAERRRDAVL